MQYSLYGARDAAQNWEDEFASTLGDLKLTRGMACPRVRQGCIRGKHIVATVHGDDIKIGGDRSVVEGGRDGITNEENQRHVREIFEDLQLKRANHSVAPWAVERELRVTQGRRKRGREPTRQGQTQTKHEWDGVSDGDDRERPQMAGVDQEAASLSTAESELYAAAKTASEGLGIQSVPGEGPCKLNLHLDASATVCLVNRRGLGKARHVNVQHLWIQEASKSEKFVTKKVGTHMNAADLITKPLLGPLDLCRY